MEKKKRREEFCQDTADLASIEAEKRKKAREKRLAKQAKQRKQTALALNNKRSKRVDKEDSVATGKSADSSSKKKKSQVTPATKKPSKSRKSKPSPDDTPNCNRLTNYMTPTASSSASKPSNGIVPSTISTAALSTANYQSDGDTTMTPSYYLNRPSTPPKEEIA